ncbi:SMP-30/gluconolactonase/LRE family protein [Kitasatospora sp. NPDC059973]|uniref:SMP-30/gluconolactonase/LRE family protein n=1 Tax=Kitasatospora sp. NPDC059973 TaxID=3347020 RepID=UPI0036C3A5D1
MTPPHRPAPHDWQPTTPDRHQLAEAARWHDDRLHYVNLLRGTLHSCHSDHPRPRLEQDLYLPLGAAAHLTGRPAQWIAATGTGIALLRPGRQPTWLAKVAAGRERSLRRNDGACDPAGGFWATSMAVDVAPGAGALHRIDRDGSAPRCRRRESSTSTRSPTARSYPRKASPKSSSAWTSSGRSTSSPTPAGSGPSAAAGTRTRHIKKTKNRTKFLEFRRCIIWRNKHATDERLREVVTRANVA